jgi:hypothetical protein
MLINFFGGPGSTKSTKAARIFSELRAKGYNAELVTEFIKYWAYQGRKCKSFDQVFIFANQLHLIDFLFQHDVEHVVCDSPLFLQCAFSKKFNSPVWKELLSIAEKFESNYKTCNIWLNRSKIPYETSGRYETHEEALRLDEYIKKFMEITGVQFIEVDATDVDKIIEIVFSQISKEDHNDLQIN